MECVCGLGECTVDVCVSEECEEDRQLEKEPVFSKIQFCSLSNPGTAVCIRGGS